MIVNVRIVYDEELMNEEDLVTRIYQKIVPVAGIAVLENNGFGTLLPTGTRITSSSNIDLLIDELGS